MSQWKNKHEKQRNKIRQECDSRGLRIRPYGNAWWIEGLGVNIVAVEQDECGGELFANNDGV